MQKELKRLLILIAALVFIILGVAGLALPFLQGFLFLIIGIILLSITSPRMRAWVDSHTVRYPRIHRVVEKMRARIEKMIGE